MAKVKTNYTFNFAQPLNFTCNFELLERQSATLQAILWLTSFLKSAAFKNFTSYLIKNLVINYLISTRILIILKISSFAIKFTMNNLNLAAGLGYF